MWAQILLYLLLIVYSLRVIHNLRNLLDHFGEDYCLNPFLVILALFKFMKDSRVILKEFYFINIKPKYYYPCILGLD